MSAGDAAARWPTIMLEIEASGDPAVLRRIVESYADALMARLLYVPEVIDPSVMLSVHNNDWDEPTLSRVGSEVPR